MGVMMINAANIAETYIKISDKNRKKWAAIQIIYILKITLASPF